MLRAQGAEIDNRNADVKFSMKCPKTALPARSLYAKTSSYMHHCIQLLMYQIFWRRIRYELLSATGLNRLCNFLKKTPNILSTRLATGNFLSHPCIGDIKKLQEFRLCHRHTADLKNSRPVCAKFHNIFLCSNLLVNTRYMEFSI
jgi:hypothetical protein